MVTNPIDIIKTVAVWRRENPVTSLVRGLVYSLALMLVGQMSWAQIGQTSFHPTAQNNNFITPQIKSSESTKQALTIYPDNLALITETRIVNLPVGISEIIFENVSELAIPETALLRGFSAVRIERNFDSRVLGKGSLLADHIGRTVKLTRTNPKTGTAQRVQAKIISASQKSGRIKGVVFEIGGRYEVLQCSGLSERVQFDESIVGQNRVGAMPTLSLRVRAEAAGPQTFVFSYLAKGFSWAADYRVTLGLEQTADLFGWLSVKNGTAKSFKDTELMVVAGTLNTAGALNSAQKQSDKFHANCWPDQTTKTPIPIGGNSRGGFTSGSGVNISSLEGEVPAFVEMAMDKIVVTASRSAKREVKQEELADYKLYRINERLNMEAYQTKQIRFLRADAIKIEKQFRFDIPIWDIVSQANSINGAPTLHRPKLVYEINNDKEGKLGKPVPAGVMRLFEKSQAGRRLITGQTKIVDTPIGEDVRVELGPSQNVMISSSVQSLAKEVSKPSSNYLFSHKIMNANDHAVQVEMRIPYPRGEKRPYNKSKKFDKTKGPNTWTLTIPANSSETLEYHLKL